MPDYVESWYRPGTAGYTELPAGEYRNPARSFRRLVAIDGLPIGAPETDTEEPGAVIEGADLVMRPDLVLPDKERWMDFGVWAPGGELIIVQVPGDVTIKVWSPGEPKSHEEIETEHAAREAAGV